MSWMLIARGFKALALLAFLMPWVAVSCSGQHVADLSGLDLILGTATTTDPMTGDRRTGEFYPVLWVALAAAAGVAGLVLSFVLKNSNGPKALAAAAVAAGILVFAGVNSIESEVRREASKSGGGRFGADAAVVSMLRFEEQTGYWLSLLAFLGAAGAGVLGVTNPARPERQS
jgi:hypothetical protein